MVSPLFSGAFYPELTLNKSLKLLLNTQTNFDYPSDYPKNPFYAFTYFPNGFDTDKRYLSETYLTFITNHDAVIPLLIKTLHQASLKRNHAGVASILSFIADDNNNEKNRHCITRSWTWGKNKRIMKKIVFNFIKNNRLKAPILQELYDKKLLNLSTYKKNIKKYRASLQTAKNITYEELYWLRINDNKTKDVMLTGRHLITWFTNTDKYKVNIAAEYYLINLPTIMSNNYLASNIMVTLENKNLKENYIFYNQLQDKLISSYLIAIIIGGGFILLVALGFIFLKKKKKQ